MRLKTLSPQAKTKMTQTGAILAVFLFFWLGVFTPADRTDKEQRLFHIERGEDTKQISIHLRDEGYARFVMPFRLFAMLANSGRNLQAGDYMLSRAMTPFTIMRKFEKGDTVKETITIVEGWDLRDIAHALSRKTKASEEEMYAITGRPAVKNDANMSADLAHKFPALADKPATAPLEGYLFPDTYEIQPSETPRKIIEKMLENFSRKFSKELREEAARQKKTIFQIVTMASLLEKEVKTYEDKQIVAGIFSKRLEIGMPLQVDATVNYITDKNTPAVSIEDTRIDSQYNTYRYRGLPQGPIANPGVESIKAALEPVQSPYLYYLSSPDGKTVFSKTLDEHNQAKAKYLKKLSSY